MADPKQKVSQMKPDQLDVESYPVGEQSTEYPEDSLLTNPKNWESSMDGFEFICGYSLWL